MKRLFLKNNSISHLTGLFAVIALSGCATDAKFVGHRAPAGETAHLIVFRSNPSPDVFRPAITLNGVQVARLSNNRYFELELQPGSYHIQSDWSWLSGITDSELTWQAEAGRTYYVMTEIITGEPDYSKGPDVLTDGSGVMAVYFVPEYDVRSSLHLANDDVAGAMMAKCRNVKTVSGVEDLIRPQ
jgi:hypothetical protein